MSREAMQIGHGFYSTADTRTCKMLSTPTSGEYKKQLFHIKDVGIVVAQ